MSNTRPVAVPITIGETVTGPVVGEIVEIPEHIAVPTVWVKQYHREAKVWGRSWKSGSASFPSPSSATLTLGTTP